MQNSQTKKGGFTSGIGFILAAAGSAVGLGNLWGFPNKTAENGGAAFVFIYIACVLFIGVTAMMCEIFIGRRSQSNPVTAFKKINKNIGWIGLIAIAVPTIIVCYYSVLGGYTVKYAANSFWGNTGIFESFASNGLETTIFTAIFVLMALLVVMGGIKGGIEKASKVLMPALFILLVAVVIFTLCLGEGVADGLKYYLIPDFSKIEFSSILAAMGQAFYSLSIGMGAMIVYGSYTGKEINIVKSTGMICIFDTCVALLSGLAIFPAVFHFAALEGISLDNIAMEGATLMFVTLPQVFESIGFAGNIIEFFFFAMVIIAAVTSVISIMEVASQFIIQRFKIKRKYATLMVAVFTFAISVLIGLSTGNAIDLKIFGEDLLSLFDIVTNTVIMPVCAMLSCIAVGWFIGPKQAIAELEADGNNFGLFKKPMAIMMKFVAPILIGVIEVFGVIDLIVPGLIQFNGFIPSFNSAATFNANGLKIVLASYAFIAILIAVYFLFFKNTDTGDNSDELLQSNALDK